MEFSEALPTTIVTFVVNHSKKLHGPDQVLAKINTTIDFIVNQSRSDGSTYF